MKIGEQATVGPLTVEKLTDTTWAVRLPSGEWTTVDEDGADFGFLGYGPAVDAVMVAEQLADEAAGVLSGR